MSRVFQVALEKHDNGAAEKAEKKGREIAERIAKAVEAATKERMIVDYVENRGGKVRVRLLVPNPDSNIGRKIVVGYEIKV